MTVSPALLEEHEAPVHQGVHRQGHGIGILSDPVHRDATTSERPAGIAPGTAETRCDQHVDERLLAGKAPGGHRSLRNDAAQSLEHLTGGWLAAEQARGRQAGPGLGGSITPIPRNQTVSGECKGEFWGRAKRELK